MPTSDRTSLSLGVERIGLLALRAPLAAPGVIAIIAVISLFGVSQLRTDDALKDLLRSDTREYRTYERLQGLFPTNELDVFAVVDLGGPLSEENLTRLPWPLLETQLQNNRHQYSACWRSTAAIDSISTSTSWTDDRLT